ncbi:MAG: tetratricopeptide repeat protein [Thiohalocapsa sp.]
MSDIFREIEDELRRDNLLQLWQRYWKYAVGVVVLALLVAGAVVAWRDYQASQREAQAARYSGALALVRDGKDAEAAKLFGELAQHGGGYAVLAGFEEAELLAKSGDRKGAAAAYDRLANTAGIDPEFRDAAVLLSVIQSFPEADGKSVIERLQPLAASGSAWRGPALELQAAAMLKSGDRDGARKVYQQLADDLSAPQPLRARAAEMAAALKS